MTLSPAFLDELRARTLLSGVIAPSVKLIKAGREWKACCPFHQEKTPSFTVNDEKGFYHCFGCGAHGDAIRFLTDQRGLPFIDAVKELAGKAGMEVPASDPRAKERAEVSAGLTDVMAAAQRWFAEQLQGVEGGAARDYLTKRGIDAATIERFGLGLAPQRPHPPQGRAGQPRRGQARRDRDADQTRRRRRNLRPLPRPPDDPDPRCARAGDRVRRADPRRRRAQISQLPRDPALRQGPHALQYRPRLARQPLRQAADRRRRLYGRHRARPRRDRGGRRPQRHGGHRSATGTDVAARSRALAAASTAIRRARKRRSARRCAPCPMSGPSAPCASSPCPRARIPTMSSRRAAAPRSRRWSTPPSPSSSACGGTSATRRRLTTPEERASLKARLMAHAGTIGDGSVRSLYRDEWLSRFDTLFARAQPQRREWKPGKWKAGPARRLCPRPRPNGPGRARDRRRRNRPGNRARNHRRISLTFPRRLAANAETLACPADRRSGRRHLARPYGRRGHGRRRA